MKNQDFSKRLRYAIQGLKAAIRSEASFRTQVIFAILVIVALGVLGASPLWWALISLCIAMVLSAELMNTALEHFIDHVHPTIHPAVGIAKDCAAGAVLIASLVSVAVFFFYLVDRFQLALHFL